MSDDEKHEDTCGAALTDAPCNCIYGTVKRALGLLRECPGWNYTNGYAVTDRDFPQAFGEAFHLLEDAVA